MQLQANIYTQIANLWWLKSQGAGKTAKLFLTSRHKRIANKLIKFGLKSVSARLSHAAKTVCTMRTCKSIIEMIGLLCLYEMVTQFLLIVGIGEQAQILKILRRYTSSSSGY